MQGDGLLEPVLGGGAPDVADGERQGVRGVGRLGGASSRSRRVTIAPTWALSARPLPVTAALTSLGVCRATGMPRRAAHSIATALAWAVPMTVRTLCWLNTRSTATNSGRCSSSQRSMPCSTATRRCPNSASLGVRTTPTPSMVSGRPATPSTTPTPHRVSPGSTPSTRTHPSPSPLGGRRPVTSGVVRPISDVVRLSAGTDNDVGPVGRVPPARRIRSVRGGPTRRPSP